MESPTPPLSALLNMKLDKMLHHWPEAGRALIKNRMACIGCDFAKFHTPTQAIEVYGLELNTFLHDLENALSSVSAATDTHMEKE